MNIRRKNLGARYGIDIRGLSTHAEVNELTHVLAVLNGHVGKARVIDRLSQAVVFEGTVEEVRESIRAFSDLRIEQLREAIDQLEVPIV